MNFEIIPTQGFLKQLKKLNKKYKSIKKDVLDLGDSLKENPFQGDFLGNNTYKVRVAIQSKNKGKSGGARVITYVVSEIEEIYLMSIYDKSELSTLTDSEIKELVNETKDFFDL